MFSSEKARPKPGQYFGSKSQKLILLLSWVENANLYDPLSNFRKKLKIFPFGVCEKV